MTYPYNPYQNPYNPYNPYQPNYQPMQQQMQYQPPVQQTPPVPSSTSTIIWVRSIEEAANYPVAPNAAVQLWSSTEPVVYLKQADASGKPTMKTYDLVERAEQPSTASNEVSGNHAYAKQEDVSALAGVVRDMNGSVSSLKEDIESIKKDMYGIAGKSQKKPVKKQESEEDS